MQRHYVRCAFNRVEYSRKDRSRNLSMSISPIQFMSLLTLKVRLGLKAEAGRYKLGYLWWILEPLLYASVFYLVFVVYLDLRTENFIAYLLTGIFPFQWFQKSVSNAMGSIKGSKGLLSSFTIHPVFFPLTHILQDAIKQVVTFAFMLFFLLFYGVAPTITWAFLPAIMVLQLAFIFGVGCFVAAIVPLLEDLRFLVATILIGTMFASGVFYNPREVIDVDLHMLFYANPVASLLQIYRDILLNNDFPQFINLYFVGCWVGIFWLLAIFTLNRLRPRYAKMVLE